MSDANLTIGIDHGDGKNIVVTRATTGGCVKKPRYETVTEFMNLNPNEPWFYIRAQDKLSVEIVMEYARLLERESWNVRGDGDEALARSLSDQSTQVAIDASRFLAWQQENPDKVKLPD